MFHNRSGSNFLDKLKMIQSLHSKPSKESNEELQNAILELKGQQIERRNNQY